MVIPAGLEPATSSFVAKCSESIKLRDLLCRQRDSNPQSQLNGTHEFESWLSTNFSMAAYCGRGHSPPAIHISRNNISKIVLRCLP